MAAYIGKTISLMDTQSIRYVGVLAGISAETSTVVLNNVTVFGTEGRRNGEHEVSFDATPRAHLEFKGKDVEDLQVLDEPVSQPQQQMNANEQASKPPRGPTDQHVDDEDFVSRTQRLAGESTVPDESIELAYNKKSSFFDNLSTQGSKKPEYFTQERSLNMETFGEEGARPQGGYRGNRSRGGRGGRGGRGRSGGRGGRGGRGGGRGAHGDQESQSHSQSQTEGQSHSQSQTEGQSQGDEWLISGGDRRSGHRGGYGGRGGRGRGGRGRAGNGQREEKQSEYSSFQPSTEKQSGGSFFS